MTRKEIENRIAARAWENKAFKQELLSNPKDTLEKEGFHIPEGIKLTVFEETPTRLALVLPMNSSSHELTEADLEAVSGGAAATQGLDFEGPIPSWD